MKNNFEKPHPGQSSRWLLSVVAICWLVPAVSVFAKCKVEPDATGMLTVVEPARQTMRAINPHAFPDFGFMVSEAEYEAEYCNEPIFHLKANFPKRHPKKLPDFFKLDPRENAEAYLLAVRDYSFEGNLPHWDPIKNKQREWYHIPWLHPNSRTGYPPNGGTEGFHGLIKEAPISPYQLAATQTGGYQVFAVTLINDIAGYTIGQMWKDPDQPDPGATDVRYGGGFKNGAVFAKLLFTDAPAPDPSHPDQDQIPFLDNPVAWNGYITENWTSPNRVVKKVHLLQMDIMVRDKRFDATTGWVLGTYAYNGQTNHENPFHNLIPLGLMWGNDPEVKDNKVIPFPPKPVKPNPQIKESIVLASEELPNQHLGWNGRLNGPADLNTTSCLSCHMMAQYPALTPIVPPGSVPDGSSVPPRGGGSDEWMRWFQNQPAAESTDKRAYSTDFSLQVVISLQNFFSEKGASQQGYFATEFDGTQIPIARGRND